MTISNKIPNCHANYPVPFILHVCIDFINQKYMQNNNFDTNTCEYQLQLLMFNSMQIEITRIYF